MDSVNENITLLVAFATRDGDAIPKGHFGEAPRFDIYRLSETMVERVASVHNPRTGASRSDHQQTGRGGGGIGRFLGEHGAQVMVSRGFGPNIQRMRRRFLPVKVDLDSVAGAIGLLQANWPTVQAQWLQGEERKHLVLRR